MGETTEGRLEVAVLGKSVYLRPHGFATQRNSLGIPDFLDAMFRVGCSCVVFDLVDCEGTDSTFLGVIADAATALPHRRGKTVVVLNPGPNVRRQIRRVGLRPLVCLCEEEVGVPEDLQLREMDFVNLPKNQFDRLQRIRHLHEQLIKLNEGNRALFGPFLEMLDEELKQSREDDQPD
jgi:hypothetical protein